ncbi:acyl-CoA carboxylase subunit epsilon [Streptomyces thermolineatus]|uniref:Acyl-CoA carboxylase subunit epsilon n=1 Tax=Streptomyces thermolineatus TaxID=44033 RepID=A0ABN3M0W4_9ACTN
MINVVRGNPAPEELAAVVAVVHARAAAAAAAGGEGQGPVSEWADPARTIPRRLPHPGPKAWRSSFWPQ